MFRIHLRASWSVLTVNLRPSIYIRSIRKAHKKIPSTLNASYHILVQPCEEIATIIQSVAQLYRAVLLIDHIRPVCLKHHYQRFICLRNVGVRLLASISVALETPSFLPSPCLLVELEVRGVAMRSKFGTNLRNTFYNPRNYFNSVNFAVSFKRSIASLVCSKISRLPGPIII